jgi:hypothetical protein
MHFKFLYQSALITILLGGAEGQVGKYNCALPARLLGCHSVQTGDNEYKYTLTYDQIPSKSVSSICGNLDKRLRALSLAPSSLIDCNTANAGSSDVGIASSNTISFTTQVSGTDTDTIMSNIISEFDYTLQCQAAIELLKSCHSIDQSDFQNQTLTQVAAVSRKRQNRVLNAVGPFISNNFAFIAGATVFLQAAYFGVGSNYDSGSINPSDALYELDNLSLIITRFYAHNKVQIQLFELPLLSTLSYNIIAIIQPTLTAIGSEFINQINSLSWYTILSSILIAMLSSGSSFGTAFFTFISEMPANYDAEKIPDMSVEVQIVDKGGSD